MIPALALGLTLGAGAAESGVVTFEYTVEYSGGTQPAGTPPWLRATFSEMGPNQVKLTLEAPGLVADEFVTRWLFNLDPAFDPDDLVVSHVGGVLWSDYDAATDGFTRGAATFDLLFAFPTADGPGRFGQGDSSEFLIAWLGPGPLAPALEPMLTLTPESFDVLSAGNKSLFAAAHVQGIVGGSGSGWLTPGQPETPIPEPGTLLLIGSGLLGLAARRRRARS